MEKSSAPLDTFAHALISPLTTLLGATGLMRRRIAKIEDERLHELIGTLERNVERLRYACDLLTRHAELRGDQIVINIPSARFQSDMRPAPAQRPAAAFDPAPPTEPIVMGERLAVLLVARRNAPHTALAEALAGRGYRVCWAGSSVEGLDLARQKLASAVILDPQIDPQAPLAIGLLQSDPDTKMLPLIMIGSEGLPNTPSDRTVVLDPDHDPAALGDLVDRAIVMGLRQRRARPQILIVDDEVEIGQVLALQFESNGYLATLVGSGSAALQIVRRQQFDLIVLDLMLPDLDGFTVLGGLRAQPETQLTPIILLSAINSPAEKVHGLQLGADDYITKPFSAEELNARVQAAMRRSEREGGANPSTRLPGNIAIERAIIQRIEGQLPFVVCYCDLDNFKAFNDTYGFLKGDAVIQRTAQLLLDVVRELGNPDDFVGHIGGDDFVLISTPDRAELIGTTILSRFDMMAPLFYDQEARERGFISGLDRQGQPTQYPLLSLSIVGVSSAMLPVSHPGEVAQRSIEPKKRAKRIVGSVFLLEE